MDSKLPYYMAYPMPIMYDDSRMEKLDIEYLRSLYPEKVKQFLPFVMEECDRMAYHGSMIYDEYPDRLQMDLMCRRICDKVEGSDEKENAMSKELIYVLMSHEIYKRRCEMRRKRRNFYFS